MKAKEPLAHIDWKKRSKCPSQGRRFQPLKDPSINIDVTAPRRPITAWISALSTAHHLCWKGYFSGPLLDQHQRRHISHAIKPIVHVLGLIPRDELPIVLEDDMRQEDFEFLRNVAATGARVFAEAKAGGF